MKVSLSSYLEGPQCNKIFAHVAPCSTKLSISVVLEPIMMPCYDIIQSIIIFSKDQSMSKQLLSNNRSAQCIESIEKKMNQLFLLVPLAKYLNCKLLLCPTKRYSQKNASIG